VQEVTRTAHSPLYADEVTCKRKYVSLSLRVAQVFSPISAGYIPEQAGDLDLSRGQNICYFLYLACPRLAGPIELGICEIAQRNAIMHAAKVPSSIRFRPRPKV
jgi:hypothetical protein